MDTEIRELSLEEWSDPAEYHWLAVFKVGTREFCQSLGLEPTEYLDEQMGRKISIILNVGGIEYVLDTLDDDEFRNSFALFCHTTESDSFFALDRFINRFDLEERIEYRNESGGKAVWVLSEQSENKNIELHRFVLESYAERVKFHLEHKHPNRILSIYEADPER